MKRNITYLAGTFFVAAGISFAAYFHFRADGISKYKPSGETKFSLSGDNDEAQDANGAAEWWFNRQKNQNTGMMDFEEMLRIQNLAAQTLSNASSTQRNSNPNSTASVMWNELGPDNVGGRTRAILFDNQDPTHQHMFAGGVSGGLWESFDAANNWHRCAGYFAPGNNCTVVTIAQAINGTLYVGTGEGVFYYPFATGAGGFLGGGIYQSTDDGLTWNLLPSTAPTASNNSGIAWADVNKIACDPADASHVYAATNKGFKESHNSGSSWTTPNGITAGTANATDVEVANNGLVIAIISSKPWRSSDFGANFTNVGTSTQGFTNAALGLTTTAIAPSDPNYVYCFCSSAAGNMYGVYASIDGAQHWTQVCGAGNSQFDPLGQGTYANAIAVDPSDKKRVIMGGLDVWEWDMVTTNPIAGQWAQLSEWFYNIFNPLYVHADIHEIRFHPTQPGTFFVGCDGGIFRTTNGGTFFNAMNSGYNVTQCYSVAFDHTAGNRSLAMAGMQDNGTNYVDGTGNTSMAAKEVGGGDGAWCDLSFLNTAGLFSTVYNGALVRSANNGQSSSPFYDAQIDKVMASPGFAASFVTPERLWESGNDLLSGDTVRIPNSTNIQNKHVTNGDSAHYSGTLSLAYPNANPAATIVLSSVMFTAGPDTMISNGAGVISGDGTGNVLSNGVYTITFNTTPAANIVVKAIFDVQYGVGTVFTVGSNIQGKQLPPYTTLTQVNPGDTIKIQDILQSHLAVGFTGNNGIWITKRAIDFSVTPDWIKVGGSHSSPSSYGGECSCLAWSADGNYLYAGTASGNVYRFANVGIITDTLDGAVDNDYVTNPNCKVTCRLIGQWAGRDVTMIDVNPNNNDEVVATLGNYSNTNYVYFTTIATTATQVAGTFVDKTANLDNSGGVPTYSCTFDKYNANRVLVGTEHGVFETGDISVTTPNWVPANTGMDNVPVDMIRQQRWDPWLVPNSGCFYIGTHGRGMWRDDSSWQQPTGINSPASPSTESNFINNHDLRVFPNPVIDNSHVVFNLGKGGDAQVQIFDLTGKLVYAQKYEQLSAGTNTVEFEANELVKGTYIIVVSQNEKQIGTGRFVKMD
jgi:hypothetical protein